jgi:thiamine biosynthesis lipoprotein
MEATLHAHSFRAMDTDIDVEVVVPVRPAALLFSIELLFRQQEERFSRFLPGSLLSRLNRGETIEDAWLAAALRLGLDASEMTGGLFNPMILPALHAAGYDRTFSEVRDREDPASQAASPDPRICIDFDGHGAQLLDGAVDLGGIVKGWTVDLAVDLLAGDVAGGLVNAGGDLRCFGEEHKGAGGWQIEVLNQVTGGTAWSGTMTGALATSTTVKRRWASGTSIAHHLIDPRTGRPAETDIAQVSCWAESTRQAEVWAKAILIGGEEVRLKSTAAGVRSVVIGTDGVVDPTSVRYAGS